MFRGIATSSSLLVVVLLCGACNASRGENLLDGCYSLGDVPIFSLRGTEGSLLIPGDITRFRLIPQDSSDHIWMTTQPSFAIGGSDKKFVRSAGNSRTPSPVIIIEYESPAASRILVRYNDQVTRLVHEDTCPRL